MDLALLHAVLTARSAFLRTEEVHRMEILAQMDLDWTIHEAIEATKGGAGR